LLPEAARLQVARRIEHLLHARSAPRPLVANDHDLARLHATAENAFDRRFLALEHARRAAELRESGVHAGGLHHGAVARQVSIEHGEAAVGPVGVLDVPNAPRGTVQIELLPLPTLAEGHLGRHAARSRAE